MCAHTCFQILVRKATNWLLGPSDRRLSCELLDTTYARGRIKVNENSTGSDCRLELAVSNKRGTMDAGIAMVIAGQA